MQTVLCNFTICFYNKVVMWATKLRINSLLNALLIVQKF